MNDDTLFCKTPEKPNIFYRNYKRHKLNMPHLSHLALHTVGGAGHRSTDDRYRHFI